MLEQQGAARFFGESALNLNDLIQVNAQGRGQVNILAADKLMQSLRLYATFLLWLLALFEDLPEVGDLDKPKLVRRSPLVAICCSMNASGLAQQIRCSRSSPAASNAMLLPVIAVPSSGWLPLVDISSRPVMTSIPFAGLTSFGKTLPCETNSRLQSLRSSAEWLLAG